MAALLQSCGSSSGGLNLPALAPLVKKALPAGFVPGATASVTPSRGRTPDNTQGSLALGYLINLFQNHFNDVQGYLLSQVAILDSRLSLFNGNTVAQRPCLANTAKPFTIDLSAIDPMLKFTLDQIQCSSPFNGT